MQSSPSQSHLSSIISKWFKDFSKGDARFNAVTVTGIISMLLCFSAGVFIRGMIGGSPPSSSSSILQLPAPPLVNSASSATSSSLNAANAAVSTETPRYHDNGNIRRIYSGDSNSNSNTPNTNDKDVFFLGVKFNFASREHKVEFMDLFRPLAEFVRQNEPDTLTYLLMESDKVGKQQLYILERYRTKSAYVDVHRKSKPFLEFRKKLDAMLSSEPKKVTIDGDSYYPTDIGYDIYGSNC